MTAPKQVASTAQEQAGAVTGTAKDQAVSVAHTATSAAGEVTGTAKEQVGSVVGETVAQAKDLTGQVREQAAQQVTTQTQRATGALRDLSRQLTEGDTSGVVGTVLTEAGQRLQGFADSLEHKGPQGLLEDLRRYARRSPGTFVLSAAAAGLVAGRLGKGMTGKPQPSLPGGSTGTTYGSGQRTPATGYGTNDGTSYGAGYTPTTSTTTYGATTGADVFGGDTYGATTPGTGIDDLGATGAEGTPEYGTGDAYGDADAAPVYPGTATTEPYATGYGQSEAYGSRGTR